VAARNRVTLDQGKGGGRTQGVVAGKKRGCKKDGLQKKREKNKGSVRPSRANVWAEKKCEKGG